MQVENTDFTVLQWLANGFDSDYMLSRLVVSLVILNICDVRLLCLWLHCILLLIVFIETYYSCCIAYGFMLV